MYPKTLILLTLLLNAAHRNAQGEVNCTPPPSGLTHWWPGNGNPNDAVGTNHATLINGVTFGQGRVESGFSFDGAGSYVNFGAGAGNFGLSDFTIDFWIRTTSTRLESVLGKRAVCAHGRFWDILHNAGILIIELDQNASPYLNLRGNRSINDGLWHHIAVVRQGLMISLFIDSTLDNSRVASEIANIFNDADLIAGRNPCVDAGSTEFFTGLLDEVDLFNRALGAAEIQAIHDAGSVGKCIAFLKITRSGTNAVLSWTTSAVGFTLQTATNLMSPTNWVDSMNIPGVLGIEYTITNALSEGSRFYRLRKP